MGIDAEYLKKIVQNELKQRNGELFPAASKTVRAGIHYEILVGIGNDSTAHIVLTDDALEALLASDG